jgi:glycosyltransferase involved in cell wall biosynthesis
VKILWVTNSIYPYRQSALDYLSSAHQLTVVTLGQREVAGGVTKGMKTRSQFFRFNIPVKQIFQIREFDLIITGGWDSIGYISLITICKKLRLPCAMLYESTLDSSRFKKGIVHRIRCWTMQSATLIVALSELSKKAAENYIGPSRKILKINNWFDQSNFPFQANVISKEGHTFLFVGRLIPLKGLDRLFRAFTNVASAEDRLHIVGEGPSLEILQKEFGDSRIEYFGRSDWSTLSAHYQKADTLVFPSLNDVYGFPCLEALASGLRVIVSENSGIWADIEKLEGVFTFETLDELEKIMLLTQASPKIKIFRDLSHFSSIKIIRDIEEIKLLAEDLLQGH